MKERDEFEALVTCMKYKIRAIACLDYFDNIDRTYIIYEHPSAKTLRQAVQANGQSFLTEAETKKCIQ